MSKAEKILQEVKQGYNLIAEHFANTRYKPWDEFGLFRQYIKDSQKILDLGCGSGRFYKFLKDQNLKIDYFGLDNCASLITICQEKYPEISSCFRVGEMVSLPYGNNFFDLIICLATFHHLPNKKLRLQALQEIYRVLEPGGYLLMTNWHLWHQPFLKHFFNQFWQKISLKDFFIPWQSANGRIQCQRYYHAFSKAELARLFKQAGFQNERIFLHQNPYRACYGRGLNLVSIVKK